MAIGPTQEAYIFTLRTSPLRERFPEQRSKPVHPGLALCPSPEGAAGGPTPSGFRVIPLGKGGPLREGSGSGWHLPGTWRQLSSSFLKGAQAAPP